MKKTKYTLIMTIYIKDNPKWIRESFESIINQTLSPSELVIICDGEITKDQEELLNEYKEKFSKIDATMNILHLEKNVGHGLALKEGILISSNELIAKMDSDDLLTKDSLEKKIEKFRKNDKLIMCGSNSLNFYEDGTEIFNALPETDEEIRKFSKKRNPFTHPGMVFKKSAVIKAGNYNNAYLFEDYDLWMRMLNTVEGEAYNIQEYLIKVRSSKDFFKRRGGLKYAFSEYKVLKNFMEKKFITKKDFIYGITVRTLVRICPNKVRELFYRKVLRKDERKSN